MKFIDEVVVGVEAGKGGNGCLSFRREKCIPLGGPNGGDGGKGGDVILVANRSLNTLYDCSYRPKIKAGNGQHGMGKACSGKQGQDMLVDVPLGTIIYDDETDEQITELLEDNQQVCVAKGGACGLGNLRFKSSTNRSPRRTTLGQPGECRVLRLELRVLADVGLLGMPNAGKSTFLRAVSAATPKVSDYPFTTLRPHLGMIQSDYLPSFVIADIPGLIAGAAQGVGLGMQFLRHLSRCHILLHLVDISTTDTAAILVSIRQVETELQSYGEGLSDKTRWLVFNKCDTLSDQEVERVSQAIINKLRWTHPCYLISAQARTGTKLLCNDLAQIIFDKRSV